MSATPRQLRRAYALGLLLFLVGVFSVTSYALWRLRTDAIANALQMATLHSRSFENYLTQSLRVSELAADNVLSVASQGTQLSQIEPSFRDILRHSPFCAPSHFRMTLAELWPVQIKPIWAWWFLTRPTCL